VLEPPSEFAFADPLQADIYRRLRELIGSSVSAFFKDACKLMETRETLEASSHVVAHLCREIEGSVRDVLRLHTTTRPVPPGQEDEKKHRREVESILELLGIDEKEAVGKAWIALTTRKGGLAAKAHRGNLDSARPITQEFLGTWRDFQTILDVVLKGFERKYANVYVELDRLLKRKPTKKTLKTLRQNIPSNLAARSYFFTRLEDPSWLAPLAKDGFFKKPPVPMRSTDDKSVSYPPWPESAFLVRMAGVVSEAERVLEIILAVPQTENALVHASLADAVLRLPPKLSARCVDIAKTWVEHSMHLVVPQRLGALVVHLLDGGCVDPASSLIRKLLEVRLVDPRKRRKIWDPLRDPQPWIEESDYRSVLEEVGPVLVMAMGLDAIRLLADVLQSAVGSSKGPGKASLHGTAGLWRSAIEPHAQNIETTVKHYLVDAIRGSVPNLVEK